MFCLCHIFYNILFCHKTSLWWGQTLHLTICATLALYFFFLLQLSKIRAAALGLQLLLLWTFTIMAFPVLNSCALVFLRITTVNFSLWHVYMMLPLRFLHTIFLYIISNKFIKIWCCVFYKMKKTNHEVSPAAMSTFCMEVFTWTHPKYILMLCY